MKKLLLLFILLVPYVFADVNPESTSITEIDEEVKRLVEIDVESAVDFCSSVLIETYADMCFNTLSKETENMNYCVMINGERKRDSCYVYFVTKIDPDYSVCDKIQSSSLQRSCNAMALSLDENFSINQIKTVDDNLKSAVNPDSASVSEINDEVKKLAETDIKSAIDFCNEIPRSTYSDMCFDILSKKTGKMEYCDMINGTRKKDSCYVSFITNNDNPDFSACNYITSNSLKRSCEAMANSSGVTIPQQKEKFDWEIIGYIALVIFVFFLGRFSNRMKKKHKK